MTLEKMTFLQGTLNEGGGSVPLISSLRYLAFEKSE
jgi:hypothetical protein